MKKNKTRINEEALPGILLLIATLAALMIANSPLEKYYEYILYELSYKEEFNLHFFVNDFLMAIFFLAVGCEIKREIVFGKLSSIKEASFPVLAAVGGMVLPAIIFTLFNYHTVFEIGAGIPLSTDIAFAIGIFAILSNKLKQPLKIFLLTLAVVDDLLSIIIIGIFYSSKIRIMGIVAAIIITFILLGIRKFNNSNKLYPYLITGLFLWAAVFYSGIHATLSGVILAFTIPVYDESKRHMDLSYKLQHKLENFNNFVILPLFAFSNTGINLMGNLNLSRDYPLMLGIIFGLVIGKPLGIMLFGYIGTLLKAANRPHSTTWYDVFVVSVIAGIGFTMSLFVAEIAFENQEVEVNVAKISILIAAIISTSAAIILSRFTNKK